MLYNLKKKCKNNHQNKRSLNKQVSFMELSTISSNAINMKH